MKKKIAKMLDVMLTTLSIVLLPFVLVGILALLFTTWTIVRIAPFLVIAVLLVAIIILLIIRG